MKSPFLLLPFLFFPLVSFSGETGEKKESFEKITLVCYGKLNAFFKEFPVEGKALSIVALPDSPRFAFSGNSCATIAITPFPERYPKLKKELFAVDGAILGVNQSSMAEEISSDAGREAASLRLPLWKKITSSDAGTRFYTARRDSAFARHFSLPPSGGENLPGAKKKTDKKEKPPLVILTGNDSDAARLVNSDIHGIAVLPLTSFGEKKAKILKVDGVPPSSENLRTLRYPLAYALWLLTPEFPTEKEKSLIDFIKGRRFAVRLLEEGILPLGPRRP